MCGSVLNRAFAGCRPKFLPITITTMRPIVTKNTMWRVFFIAGVAKLLVNTCKQADYLLNLHIMGKGRDKILVALRDEALCRRYYYWTEEKRLRFDDALTILSKQEFFISEERIMSIIRRKCHEIKDIQLRPVPKVRMPRLTARQLELFRESK